jgi:hypothetical protein
MYGCAKRDLLQARLIGTITRNQKLVRPAGPSSKKTSPKIIRFSNHFRRAIAFRQLSAMAAKSLVIETPEETLSRRSMNVVRGDIAHAVHVAAKLGDRALMLRAAVLPVAPLRLQAKVSVER